SNDAIRPPYLVFASILVVTAGAIAVATARASRSPSRGRRGWAETPSVPKALSSLLVAATLAVAVSLAAAHAAAASTALGVYVPHGDLRPSHVERFAHQVGRAPAIVSSYKRWPLEPFVASELRDVWSGG